MLQQTEGGTLPSVVEASAPRANVPSGWRLA